MDKYENGAVVLENGDVIEPEFVNIHEQLSEKLFKLKNNVEKLGREKLPDEEDINVIREKGREVLKTEYSNAYKKITGQISELGNEYIRVQYNDIILFKDAIDVMLVDPVTIISDYLKKDAGNYRKALFIDYSLEDFDDLIKRFRERVSELAFLNWSKHNELAKRK